MLSRHQVIERGFIVVAAIVLVSCSATRDPMSPTTSDRNPIAVQQDVTRVGKAIWGTWEVTVEPITGKIEAVPVRGAEFAANVTMFLQPPAGKLNNLKFQNLDLANWFAEGLIELDVGLTHPFPGLDQYTGFDVMGVFRHEGSYVSDYDAAASWGQPGVDGVVLNADGYTRWFNISEFTTPGIFGYGPGSAGTPGFMPTATLNGFKFFADGLDKDQGLADYFAIPENCATRGCFRPGSTNYRHYVLQFPMDGDQPVLKFQYSVIANWAPPESPPPPPEDFPIEANMAEALILSMDTSESTLYYLSGSNKGGTLRARIEILDHQGAGNPGGILGEIAGIVVESPTSLFGGTAKIISASELAASAEPGGPSSSAYSFDIPKCSPDSLGEKPLLIWVLSASPTTYDSGTPGWVFPESAELAGYAAASAVVGDVKPNLPPVGGDLSFHWACTGDPCSGQTITFEVSEAYDPDGDPVTISWDFDGDMIFGDDADGDDTNLSGTYIFATPGPYDVRCRIADTVSHTDIGPLSVNVMDCSPDAPQLTKSAASITQPGYGYGVDVNPKDGYAYVTVSTGNHGALCVFDVDPVDETHETGSVGFTYLQICVAYYDDKAHNKDYVYVGGVYLNGLATVDVTDPASPQIVNVVDTGLTPAMLNDMVIVGKYLYVAAQWGGILVFDLTNPALPNMVGHTPWGYGTVINSNSVAVTSDGLTGFYTDGYEVNPDMDDYVKSVNLSDKSAPTVEDSLWVPTHFSSNMDIQGKTLYLNCGYSGNLLIIDITDPTNLATISTTSIGGYSDIVVRGNNAYLTGGSLSVFDISEPLAVHQVGVSLGLPGGGVCVKEVCGKLYIAISNTATHLSIVSLY